MRDPQNSIANDLTAKDAPLKNFNSNNKVLSFLPDSIENNTPLFGTIIAAAIVLIIIIFSAFFYFIKKSQRKTFDQESFSDEQVQKIIPANVIVPPVFRKRLAIRSKVFRLIQQKIPNALADGIPDRLYYFSYNQGIDQFSEVLRYLFMSTNTGLLARKPYKAIQVGEIDVLVGDELFIEKHSIDGWCTGFNSTQDTIGLFPLYCTSPRYPVILTLVHIGGGPGEISESIINSCVAFPQHLSYRILDRMPSVQLLSSLFVGSSQCLTKCIVSGDEIFLSDIQEAFGAAIIEGVDVPMVDEILV
jgi:hypothetical protein